MSHCDFVAGWGGGIVGLMVGHPLDTIKVNQQTQGVRIGECTRAIYQKQGWKGFFRGMGFPLVAQGAMNSVFFGAYGYTLEHLNTSWNYGLLKAAHKNQAESIKYNQTEFQRREISFSHCFIAGLVAGLAQLSIACPTDVIKIKLQTRTAELATFRGPIVLVRHILKTQGIRGLYQGVWTMALRDMPASGVYMLLYEVGSSYVKNSSNRSHVANSIGLFLAGGVAGVVSWWLILPLDVVKSHLQSQDKRSPNYRGALESTKYILRQQGLKGLFRGFSALSIRAFPVNGATLLTYEWATFLCHYFQDTSNFRLNALGN